MQQQQQLQQQQSEYSIQPFDDTILRDAAGIDDVSQYTFANVRNYDRAYGCLLRYLIASPAELVNESVATKPGVHLTKRQRRELERAVARKGVQQLRSFEVVSQHRVALGPLGIDDDDDEISQSEEVTDSGVRQSNRAPRHLPALGLGVFKTSYYKRDIIIVHQTWGPVVGTSDGPAQMRSLLLMTKISPSGEENARQLLLQLCSDAVEWDEQSTEETYRIYQWSHDCKSWRSMAVRAVRPIDSVILPHDMKKRLMNDLDSFSSRQARKWYYDHGISYKRSYLFCGPPGTGKSSFLRVLAGHLKRNLALLHPVDPRMTDDSILTCMQQSPDNSIVVLEDIDALFDKDRQSKLEGGCPLTFSGLLNALDGVGNKDGQIFVLTTNHPERLDPALVRPGRVDMRVDFPAATLEQVEGLFLHFYPGESTHAKSFVEAVAAKIEQTRLKSLEAHKKHDATASPQDEPSEGTEEDNRRRLSMAALQQHFISCRLATAQEVVERLATFELI